MRLGLIYHQFIPRGGLEGYLMEFALRLKAAGHELDLVTGELHPALEKELGATVHRVPLVRGSALLRMWQFEREASRLASTLPVAATIGFGRTTTHDLHRAGGGCHAVYSQLLPPWKRWTLKNFLELKLERELYTSGRTRRFVVNSGEVARQLHEIYGTPREQFEVIHTAVDTQKFHPAEDHAAVKTGVCSQLKSDPTRPAFLFVSLSHRRKGLDALLEAWTDIDADLWIVGKELNAGYRALVASLGLQKKVKTLAAQSNVAVLYQAADWFIHPTQYDACANTVLHSMACGLPGLISVNDGAIDLLQDGSNGLLLPQPQDPGVLQQNIKKALSMDEASRARLGAAARETVVPLTWEAHLRKWLLLIEKLSL
ncbi:MAG TPA: glycosyltransferase family 4 protein [Verrucomicrobium sp.]|nr:glycosyltransferase family 4 protein [Verrucomicrobium sp.]